MFINIYSKGKYPSNELSNFAYHSFDFDGFKNIPCMESFLQSLKFEDTDEQKRILYMPAKAAKSKGSHQQWDIWLYWKGEKINRFSKDYYSLLSSAYHSLLKNNEFREALIYSRNKVLIHTIGRSLRRNTVLTWWEFVIILTRLRREIVNSEHKK